MEEETTRKVPKNAFLGSIREHEVLDDRTQVLDSFSVQNASRFNVNKTSTVPVDTHNKKCERGAVTTITSDSQITQEANKLDSRFMESPSNTTAETILIQDTSDEVDDDLEQSSFASSHGRSYHHYRPPPPPSSHHHRNVDSPYTTISVLTSSSEEYEEEEEETARSRLEESLNELNVSVEPPAQPVRVESNGSRTGSPLSPFLAHWAKSRQRRVVLQEELKARAALQKALEHKKKKTDMNDSTTTLMIHENHHHSSNGNLIESDEDDEEEDDDDDDDEEEGVIAIGLPAVMVNLPPLSVPDFGSDINSIGDDVSQQPPPPRTMEEANQRIVSHVMAQNVAEEEHNVKMGEKERLASSIERGTVRVVPRTPWLLPPRATSGHNNNNHNNNKMPSAPSVMDEMTRIKNQERERIASAVGVSAAGVFPRTVSSQQNVNHKYDDESIKNAIKREMQGYATAASRNNAATATTSAAAAAATARAVERSRLEQSKLNVADHGPSVALAAPTTSAPVASTASMAAAYATARFRQELDKMTAADRGDSGMVGPALAPATVELTSMSSSSTTTAARQPGAFHQAATAATSETKKLDDGPSLAPAMGVGSGELMGVEASISRSSSLLGPTPSSSSTRENRNDELEAQTGIPILPGAFAIEGIEAANRRRSSTADGSHHSGHFLSNNRMEDFDDEHSFDSRHHLVMAAPSPANPESETAVIHIIDSSYAVGEMALPSALEAELQVVVEGAVIAPEEEFGIDAKAVKKLRYMQVSIVCFALAAIGVIVGIVVGMQGKQNQESIGWTQVGADLLGPKEQPQAFFMQSLAISQDGSRIAAAAPGMDLELELNVGEILIMDVAQTANGTSQWVVHDTLVGDDPNPIAESSLTMSHDGKILVSGQPHLGTTGQVFTYQDATGYYEPLSSSALIPTVGDESVSSWDSSMWFGYAVSLTADGTVLAVGAPMMNVKDGDTPTLRTGGVYCYQLVQGAWNELGVLQGQDENEMLGWSVTIQATPTSYRLAAGGPSHDAERGIVRIFDHDNGEWSLVTTLEGEEKLIRFGESLAWSQDATVLAVGARGNALDKGRVHVYRLDKDTTNNKWVADEHVLEGQEHAEGYGAAVALSEDGSVLAIGAPQSSESGLDAGRVEVYQYDDAQGMWMLEGKSIHGSTGEEFGSVVALAMQGKRLAVGAPSTTFDGSIAQAGAVRVYDRDE